MARMVFEESLVELRKRVLAQKELVPSLYGKVNFDHTPERFADQSGDKSFLPDDYARKYRNAVLIDPERLERARLYTLLGDTVSDRYAALMHNGHTMKELIGLLHQACARGLDAMPRAPQELHDFIHSMETVPDWIDMDLVREGAKVSRNYMANLVPFAIRGAFIATFMNKYSGLPMALTGALGREGSSTQRINETASFFTAVTLPGALERNGNGFLAAAMVRLMHSIVRFNLINHSKVWDMAVYGIPVPQVDQMPAGTMPSFLNAFQVISRGHKHFNRKQRAVTELCRYQSYLLGLPKDLLPSEPQDIFDVMVTYASTLRDGYDDSVCGELIRQTVAAYRPKKEDWLSRIYNEVETGFSKVFFARTFLKGTDRYKAKIMGVEPSLKDYVLFAAANGYVVPRLIAFRAIQDVPVLGDLADDYLIKRIKQLLHDYGHAEYITDVKNYSDGTKDSQEAVKPVFNRATGGRRPAPLAVQNNLG